MLTGNYEEMDNWDSKKIAEFKETAKLKKTQASIGMEARLLEETTKKPGKIIAEGDSWFDYMPGTDLMDCLKNLFDYDIDNYATAGDTLENMIFGTRINKNFQRVTPQIETVLLRIQQVQPKVFLFSGGGNDIAGDEFESYLNHKNSDLPVLREEFVNKMIDVVFREYLDKLIKRVALVSPNTHVVMHGYGHTIPTGEGVDLLFFTFAGPWMRPALAKKGIFDPTEQKQLVFNLIDKYNGMLKALDDEHDSFHHVDLRSVLNPQNDWVNELHLKNSAYARSAREIHSKIQSLL